MNARADDNDFCRLMEPVALRLLGEPNKHLSSATELRWGSQGSMSVDLEKGVWSDHEAATGGGVMDFLKRELKLSGQDAIAWLNENVAAGFEDRQQRQAEVRPMPRLVATYDYVDEHGELLFQVCRFEPKDFRQRRPDGSGWSWSVKGVRQVPYRLNELSAAIAKGETVYVVEGEKDADALAREGAAATCNAMGAGKWTDSLSEPFAGADVVILPDNDDAGRAHALAVAASLRSVAAKVRILDLPDLPPKGDVSDWLALGGDECELAILAAKTKPWAAEAPRSRFGAVTWDQIEAANVSYVPLVKGLIYQGDKGMIFGESGSGKSFLAVDMGLSIARGVPFLGMKTTQGSVLYQAGEGGRGLIKRLKAYRQEHRITENLPFVLLPERVDLFSPEGDVDAFIAECVAFKAYLPPPLALVVIDTFSAASPGANENASEDMGRMLAAGDAIAKATGAAVVWVHHKNAAGLRERGHTSFRANIETAIEVRRDADTKERTLHLVKLKDGEDGLALGFELQSVELGSDDDGDLITSCVVRPAQLGSSQTGKRPFLPRGQYQFLKVLDDAIGQWGGAIPGEDDAYGVDWDAFRDLYGNVCGIGKNDNATRQALHSNARALASENMIRRKDRWLWITPRGMRYIV